LFNVIVIFSIKSILSDFQTAVVKFPFFFSALALSNQNQPAMTLFVLLLAVALASASAPDEKPRSLAPLRVLQITPSFGDLSAASGSTPFVLQGADAITVVFNRAVVALGADWGKDLSPSAANGAAPFSFVGLERAVPGKLRWVTTSIARFDPDGDWPTDLRFSVAVDGVTTHDGSRLAQAVSLPFATKPIALAVRGVTSAKASQLTGNVWTPFRGQWQSSSPQTANDAEVPSDGVVTLNFMQGAECAGGYSPYSYYGGGCPRGKIDVALVANSLVLRNKASGATIDIKTSVKACKFNPDFCVSFTPPALDGGAAYELTLPAGARYSAVAGPVRVATSVPLFGLFPFELPFSEQTQLQSVSARRWRVFLRHGLADGTACDATACAALASQLAVTDAAGAALAFELRRLNAATLELYVPAAQPQQRYTVVVTGTAAVRDGFGQALQSSRSTLTMRDVDGLLAFDDAALFESTFSANMSFVHRKQGVGAVPAMYCSRIVRRVAGANIDGSNVAAALSALRSQSGSVFANSITQDLSDSSAGAQTTALPTEKLWGASGTFMVQTIGAEYPCTGGDKVLSRDFVSRADLTLTVVGEVAQVTRPSTNALVAAAKVTLYDISWNGAASVVDSKTTDANGLVSLKFSNPQGELVAVIQSGSELAIARNLPAFYRSSFGQRSASAITTDRNLYKEGDTVSIKGYLRSITDVTRSDAEFKTIYGSIQWLDDDAASSTIFEAKLNEFNAFAVELRVPSVVTYGVRQVSFNSERAVIVDANSNGGGGEFGGRGGPFGGPFGGSIGGSIGGSSSLRLAPNGKFLGAVDVNIADPRVPTGVLEISAVEAVYKPKTTTGVQLKLSTQTYTGAPLAKSEVTVAWSLQEAPKVYDGGFFGGLTAFYDYVPSVFARSVRPSTPAQPTPVGERVFTTDENGLLTAQFFLTESDLAGFALKDGQTLKLEARMIGATRELLKDELTLPLRASPWQVRVKASSENLVPSLNFGVSVDVVDADGKSQTGVSVAIELAEASDSEASAIASLIDESTGRLRAFANAASAQKCQVTSDGGAALHCTSLVMKTAKKHLLRASVAAPDGSIAETALPLGRSADEWAAAPVRALPLPTPIADKKLYKRGDSVKLSFMNPFAASRALVYYGNVLATRFVQVQFSAQGLSEITLPTIGTECDGGCTVSIALQAPRDASRSLAGAPISNLFDLTSAQALSMQAEIDVEDKSLALGTVTVSSDAPNGVTAPRKPVEFEVKVNGADGKPLASGEVHLFVVDRKILDLAPHAVLAPAEQFSLYTKSYTSIYQTQRGITSFDIHQRTLVRVARRAAAEPWQSMSWEAFADVSDEQFNRMSAFAISYFSSGGGCDECDVGAVAGGGGGGGVDFDKPSLGAGALSPKSPSREAAGDAAAPAEGAAKNGGGSDRGAAAGKAPVLRTEPVWTPLSATAVVVNGVSKFQIKNMPDNLGTFRVVALATDGKAYASAETSLVSRLEYNVEPSLPRIARVGDRFAAGVSVSSNLDKARYPVTLFVAVSVTCAFVGLLDASASQKVVLTAPGAVRVEFGFEAFGVTDDGRDAAFYFTLVDAQGSAVDQLVARVPVLPQQDAVTVATSFALEATTSGQGRTEGFQIPEHVDGSATVAIQAGVGRLPAMLTYTAQLLAASEQIEPSGLDFAAALVPSWLFVGAYEASLVQATSLRINGAFKRAVSELKSLTDAALGLQYYRPRSYWRAEAPDVPLNTFALWASSKLTTAEQELLPRALWTQAVSRGLDYQAQQARRWTPSGRFGDFDLLVEVFFTLGFDFEVQSSFADDFSSARLFANTDKLSSRGEALLAAALIEQKVASQSALLDALLLKLNNKMRVQGRTAYVAWAPGSKFADLSASIDGLLALSVSSADKLARIAEPKVLTEKLANWIAAPSSEIWYGVGAVQAARSAYALLNYDRTRGNDRPSFVVRAAVGSFELLTTNGKAGVAFTSPSQAPAQASVNAWLLPPHGPALAKEKLQLYAKGSSGEASVVVSVDFVPCERNRAVGPQCKVSSEPVYRGIEVQKVIRRFNATTGASVPGAGITSAQSGEQVEVTIQISTPDDLTNVRVVDWLPASLEALEFGERPDNVGFGATFYGWWRWSTFQTVEVRKDRVQALAYQLPAGTHTLTYTALVVTPGLFSLPPAKAYAVAQPELLGLSAGGVFGAADPAWSKVIAGRQAQVCSFDPIRVNIDGVEKLLPPANIGDTPTASPTFEPLPVGTSVVSSAVSVVLSSAVALAALLLSL